MTANQNSLRSASEEVQCPVAVLHSSPECLICFVITFMGEIVVNVEVTKQHCDATAVLILPAAYGDAFKISHMTKDTVSKHCSNGKQEV